MSMEPHIFDCHRELTADAAEGASIQLAMMARFIRQGECLAAVATYSRVKPIIKEYLHPGMQVIEASAPDTLTKEAAAEWRANRKPPRNEVGVLKEVRKVSVVHDYKVSQVGAVKLHRATKAGEARI